MANEFPISQNGDLRHGRNIHRLALYLVGLCRRPLVAYIAIAFAISFGFHELEQHADKQIVHAIREGCERGNVIRTEFNNQLLVLQEQLRRGSIKGSVVINPIPMTDCRRIPKP